MCARFYAQCIYPHPSNSLNLVYSNAVRIVIGTSQVDGQCLIGAKGATTGQLPQVIAHLVTELQGTSFQ